MAPARGLPVYLPDNADLGLWNDLAPLDGDGGGSSIVPPPPPPATATVTFAGINSPDQGGYTGVSLNGPYAFTLTGGSYPTQNITSGFDPFMVPLHWDVSLGYVGGNWVAGIIGTSPGTPSGGFDTATPEPLGTPIANLFTTGGGDYAGDGTATVTTP